MNQIPLLEIKDLHVSIGREENRVQAIRGASLRIEKNTRLGIIGESGSGKTLTALAILRLLPATGTINGGNIIYEGKDLLTLSEAEMSHVRGKQISIVFQNAAAALNPLYTVGQQIADVYKFQEGCSSQKAWAKAIEMLNATGIPDPERRARAYPNQYSGGMAQRALIAMALVCSPNFLIADEPTTGLDLTIQAQVLDLIKEHVVDSKASLMLISHDIAVIAEVCTHVAVMYAGEVLESGSLEDVFTSPASPYCKALLDCFNVEGHGQQPYIAGRVPDLRYQHTGCLFAPRCKFAADICQSRPELREIKPNHWAACHFA
jgi:oligopeptide/dipeptide ABC transporter ATP-binding protein